ncbi:hypothetical protein MKZ38_000124 [Zalerion maritima]|uniref:DUF7704 domain-containing protein n=1 Tax=Zalerion maritima TaxID=339359 RepID=A0AAD5WSQ7_9PEZI|nr:hypothetical protein MKZ38_000124 [Zalerion maritima]
MMASSLPPFPRAVFTTIEPISLVAGGVAPFISPDWFISEQIARHEAIHQTSDNARLVALQLGNAYLLLCMLGIAILSTTTEIKVVRGYLFTLWAADIGHIGVTYFMLGHARFTDLASWNAMTWGNVAATAFLFLTRTAYFLGLFGQDRIPDKPKRL